MASISSPLRIHVDEWDILKLLPPRHCSIRDALVNELHRLEFLPVEIPEIQFLEILETILYTCNHAISNSLHRNSLEPLKPPLARIIRKASFLEYKVQLNGSADRFQKIMLDLRENYQLVY